MRGTTCFHREIMKITSKTHFSRALLVLKNCLLRISGGQIMHVYIVIDLIVEFSFQVIFVSDEVYSDNPSQHGIYLLPGSAVYFTFTFPVTTESTAK